MTWEYIAGFIDGEGSIVKRKSSYGLYISQTNFPVLEEIRKFVGGGYVYSLGKRKAHWKDAWLYSAGGNENLFKILSHVADKLIVKQDLASRVLIEIKIALKKERQRELLKAERIKKGRELRKNGWSYRKIGKELGTDWGYARRILIPSK